MPITPVMNKIEGRVGGRGSASPLHVFSIALLVLALMPAIGQACAICKDAWTGTSEGMGFAKGIYYSIVLMLGMFFGMVGLLIAYIVKQANKPLRSWDRAAEGGKQE